VNRRGFLKYLGLSTGSVALAAALPPAISWALTEPIIAGTRELVSAPRLPLDWMVDRVATRLDELLGASFGRLATTRSGTTQWNAAFHPAPFDRMSPRQFAAKHLDAVADLLAHRIRKQGWTRFGELDLPRDIEAAARVWRPSGVSVRAIQHWRLMHEGPLDFEPIYRFDVLGG
jgi:hypothetical protein